MYLYNMAESKVMEGVRESLRSNHGTVRGLFQAWDTNRDGVLEPSELSHAVCGNNAPVEATSSLFSSLASNGRLGIEYADLYHVLKQGGTTTSSTGRERRSNNSSSKSSDAVRVGRGANGGCSPSAASTKPANTSADDSGSAKAMISRAQMLLHAHNHPARRASRAARAQSEATRQAHEKEAARAWLERDGSGRRARLDYVRTLESERAFKIASLPPPAPRPIVRHQRPQSARTAAACSAKQASTHVSTIIQPTDEPPSPKMLMARMSMAKAAQLRAQARINRRCAEERANIRAVLDGPNDETFSAAACTPRGCGGSTVRGTTLRTPTTHATTRTRTTGPVVRAGVSSPRLGSADHAATSSPTLVVGGPLRVSPRPMVMPHARLLDSVDRLHASLHDCQDATFTERHESELEAWIEDEVKMNQAAHHAAHDLRQPVPDFSWLRITK